jgi:hypothetical protein
MTDSGVCWRAYLLAHPLVALWVGLTKYPSRGWQLDGSQLASEYFWYGFYLTPLLIVGLHGAVSWAYAQRRYTVRQALWVGLLSGSVVPGLVLVFLLIMLLVQPLTEVPVLPHLTLRPSLSFWIGLLFYLGQGQLLALSHWLFYRRGLTQQALAAGFLLNRS